MGQYKEYGRKAPLPPENSSLAATEHIAKRHKNITILPEKQNNGFASLLI